jgi:hypothetical protein
MMRRRSAVSAERGPFCEKIMLKQRATRVHRVTGTVAISANSVLRRAITG